MAEPVTGEIAPGLDLTSDFVIQFTALDATTGAVVSGVTVSDVSLLVENVEGGDLTPSPPEGDPLWISLPNDFTEANGG